MDRNEVVLVGRLSAAPEDKPLPSGDILTKWRLIVRRPHHRSGQTMTDSVPCATFDPEAAAFVRSLRPRDTMEIKGAFRCHVYGPTAAKIWRYEVEVSIAKEAPPDEADQPRPSRRPRKPFSLSRTRRLGNAPEPPEGQKRRRGPALPQSPEASGSAMARETPDTLASVPTPRPAPDLAQTG
ncbi:single-stranded DNA-binding protein [Nonomuraea guangzhouensis]|uniref:Single-stranded DNA-binding protein n=1 Tax=Nonomuraea guangzhouensis TaxID=1291555 RepID=A0ABW4GKH2_9ACTN|nr:single-stranded DNA-binding protein [Nonomuraea guangzhouensis]